MNSTVSLTSCDHEPIHMPSAIQQFGAIIVADANSLKIVQASTNVEEFLKITHEAILGKTIAEICGVNAAISVAQRSNRIEGNEWIANVWYQARLVLIEVEKKEHLLQSRLETNALNKIQATQSLNELLNTTAMAVAELTQLDRVMIYRFHDDLHGEVVAEAVRHGVESYKGLHYPASDIPLPARAVFLKNWVRMIPKVNYEPLPIQPVKNPITHEPLDLGTSVLRAVSPIHIEYLKNMGVGASLTISLVVNGKLWGLIACHHLHEHYVSIEVRDACEAIGRMSSAFIAVRMEADLNAAKQRFETVHKQLAEFLHSGNDMAAELTRQTPNLSDLITSEGSAAALYLDGYWAKAGKTPAEEELEKLVDWLIETHPSETVYTTSSLAVEYPGAKNFNSQSCGLMAISIPKTRRNYILWFRPEIVSTVTWAGKPEKQIDQEGRLHPRSSFEIWNEQVNGKSAQWTELEQTAGLELRNAIMAVELQLQYQKEQAARIEAERATKAREELMAVLSHDLKNPLGSIRLGAQFATRFLTPESFEKVRDYLTRIERSTASMDALISDILSITKLEAGHMDSEHQMANLNDILSEVVDLVAPIATEKKIDLKYEFKMNACETSCDRGQIFQVVSNIVGNAIKFTPDGGKIRLILEGCGPEFVKIAVSDTGPGIHPDNLSNIFDRFWQAQQTKRLGTGLGLAIVKGIVEAHAGKVWAESDGKSGTIFHVTLPLIRTLRKA